MLNRSLWKLLTQPIAGVALLVAVIVAFPTASQAQRRPVQRSTQINTNYTLGGGDRIKVNVFEVPDYSGDYQIPPGGAINLPLIGSVPIQGLTTEEAADEIIRRYSRYLKRPNISVSLLSPRPINVTVAGEVSRPGAYSLSLQGGAGDNPGVQYPTVLSAIATAQGITYSADVTRVELRRKLGRGRGEQVVNFDLKQIIQTGTIPQDITLRDGDTIFIPTGRISLAEIRQLSYAGIAPDSSRPRTVVIAGEVTRPGSYLVTAGSGDATGTAGGNTNSGLPNVTRTIQLAGGLTSLADIRNIQLRRRARNGSDQTYNINLWQLLQGDINQDTLVQDGDTIVIPKGNTLNLAEIRVLSQVNLAPDPTKPRQVAVIGAVNRPGTYLVTQGNTEGGGQGGVNVTVGAGGGQPTVSRAIQLAGGITPEANIREVQVRRLARDGEEKIISVNLFNILRSGDLSQDTILQEGDTVIVATATDPNPAELRELSSSTLSPGTIQVGVSGEVKRPGNVILQPNSTLNQALLAAGGFDGANASSDAVDLVRLNPDGSVTKRKVKVDFAAASNTEKNPILRNNDVVVVYRSGAAKAGQTVGAVINPLAGILGIVRSLFLGF